MVWWLLILALLVARPAVAAESIVPVTSPEAHVVESGDFKLYRFDFPPMPPGVVAIVGWSGWLWHENHPVAYSTFELWHDGGTPHLLQVSFGTFKEPQGSRDFFPIMLPAPGHAAKSTDQFFFNLGCAKTGGTSDCNVYAGVTLYLRVQQ